MLDLANFDPSATSSDDSPYQGQERRRIATERSRESWLAATLDELDYGILLLDDALRVIHLNHAARSEFDADHPLQLCDQRLRARRPTDRAPLDEALNAARSRGLRKQWALGDEQRRVSVSVVPLRAPRPGQPAVLVMLSRRRTCSTLSALSFASSHRLSATESQVLVALCRGDTPVEIADNSGVAISTIRTQISSIRIKTGASSIRALLQQVSTLPPLMCVLRSVEA